MIELFLDSLKDLNITEVFKKVQAYLNSKTLLRGDWQILEITLTTNGTIKYPHSLKTKPLDVIQTSILGTGTVEYLYEEFTRETVSIRATGVVGKIKIRAFIGGGN